MSAEDTLLPVQRQQLILDLLGKNNTMSLEDLVEKIGKSESTVRRDLKELSHTGQVLFLRGGVAQLPAPGVENDLMTRIRENREGKERIARYAAQQVSHEDTIFLDASSISYMMIDFLRAINLTVVTNSLPHAQKVLQFGIKCLILGGEVAPKLHACGGPLTEYMLDVLHIGKAFISSAGISREEGVTCRDPFTASLKKLVVRHSARAYFMMDSTKHGVVTLYQVVPIQVGEVLVDRFHASFEGLPNINVVGGTR